MIDMALQIIQKLVPEDRYKFKSYTTMNPLGVCIHNTYNEAPATNEVSYMTNNDSKTSFHYAVDDIQAIQALPENRTAWHAGDNLGQGNMRYIAIEICYSFAKKLPAADVYAKFDKAEKNAVLLVVQILKRYGWGIDQVKKHQDFSGKYCPHRTLDLGWGRFLNMVKAELNPPPVVIPKPFIEGSIIYPIEDLITTSTAGYANSATATLKKGTKCKVMKYHDKNGLYMALGDAQGVYFSCAWTKEFNKFSIENPFMDEIIALNKTIEELNNDIKKLKEDMADYLSLKASYEEYKETTSGEIDNLREELRIKSESLQNAVDALNEYRHSKIGRLVVALVEFWKKFKEPILDILKKLFQKK